MHLSTSHAHGLTFDTIHHDTGELTLLRLDGEDTRACLERHHKETSDRADRFKQRADLIAMAYSTLKHNYTKGASND